MSSAPPRTRRRWRPTAAARASFSMTQGRPSRASSASRRARSVQPRLTAIVTLPVRGSTRPGTPTPITATLRTSAPASASAVSTVVAIASAAPSWSPAEEARVARPRMVPSGVVMSTAIFVPPTSTPTRSGPVEVGPVAVLTTEVVAWRSCRSVVIDAPSARARGSAAARTCRAGRRRLPGRH